MFGKKLERQICGQKHLFRDYPKAPRSQTILLLEGLTLRHLESSGMFPDES